jgi:hypothetical protein
MSSISQKTYSETDYNSNDGMLVSVWGPPQWHFLHTMSFNYPVNPTSQDKKHYRDYMLQLVHVLPCGKCRRNLKENYKKLPLTMDHMQSRATFSKYVYDLHEVVNTMLNKKSNLSYEQVKERYEHFRARCAKNKPVSSTKKNNNNGGHIYGHKFVNGHKFINGHTSIQQKTIKRKHTIKNNTHLKKDEKGCTVPLVGEKSKCILKIVPHTEKCDTFIMNKKCIKKRIATEENVV